MTAVPTLHFHVLGTLDLLGPHGKEVRALLVQPKRLALFTYLLLAKPAGYHRRDSLIALFWPESDTERARLALRQALHFLRRTLGRNVIVARGDEEIAIADDGIWCDAVAFERALEEQRFEEALELYGGDLLAGFFPSAVSPEFEQWLDRERARLRERTASAAWQLADKAERERNGVEATNWARKAVLLDPDGEGGVRRLIALLDRCGDRAGALREYDDFADRLRREFQIEPSPETTSLIAAVRARERTDDSSGIPDATAVPFGEQLTREPQPSRRRLAGVLIIAALLLAVAATLVLRASRTPPPLLAVGHIANEAGASDAETARLLSGLLTTDLARVVGLPVMSQTRLLEALPEHRNATQHPLASAARHAGATELVEGVLYRRGKTLRLDLRRVDLVEGVIRQSYSVSGSNAFDLTEQATAEIAHAFGLTAPATPLARSGSGSLVARGFYEQGLSEFYRGEWRGAYKLFSAALSEDSTFAMAAYYAARSIRPFRTDSEFVLLRTAARLAERAPQRERLTIKHARYVFDRERSTAFAESLAVRFPDDPAGYLALADARWRAGDFTAAVRHARHVIEMDSLSLHGKRVVCSACDGFDILARSYRSMGIDSFIAVERTAREWIRRQPQSVTAWRMLAEAVAWRGRKQEALQALNTAMQVEPARAPAAIFWRAVFDGESYREAERVLRDRLRFNASDGIDWFIHTLRQQGRPKDALAFAQRAKWTQDDAQLLLEGGRIREAAQRFEAAMRLEPNDPNELGYEAWKISWAGQHAATAWAAVGDTQRVAQIVRAMERVAPRASHGLAWRAPAYVRGLLWQARGQHARAAEEFRAAIYSPTLGFTRANLELARAQLALGKPQQAVRVLREVLGGTSTGPGYYVTRAEVHEALAHAFEAAQQPDSAAVHYRAVVNAWSNGEPSYRARAQQAQRKLDALAS